MVFSSLLFLYVFLPIALFLYYISPEKIKNFTLFILSLIFYAWGEPIYVGIMLFSSVFDYCNGRLLNKFKEDWKRKAVLILSVIVNIGLLFFFKYYNFVIDNLNYLFKLNISASTLTLPLGISFYTFQTLSYTIDVYRGEVEASNSFFDYSAYVAMFPQLVAGPIVRYIDIYNQLKNRDFSDSSIAYGIKRFVYGLAKKVLIANKLGELYKIILAKEVAGLASSMAWLGIIAFTLQIYFDFSGYSDMAIGLGRMLGFDFLENFNFPYISRSITEFWRRWHMSLSLWFRNYVYIPLGGNRVKVPRQILNLFITWFLTGFWHGADFNFIIWGLYYFTLLVLEKFVYANALDKAPNFIKHIYTMLLVIIGWVIFEFKVVDIGPFIKAMFNFKNFASSEALFYLKEYGFYLALGAVLSLGTCKKLICKERKTTYLEIAFLFILLILVTMSLISESYNPFLYFRF